MGFILLFKSRVSSKSVREGFWRAGKDPQSPDVEYLSPSEFVAVCCRFCEILPGFLASRGKGAWHFMFMSAWKR